MIKNKKILIVGPSWVGDMVMSQSLYQLLKKQNPEVIIDVLAPAWTQPLLDCMPEVNEAIALPFQHGEFQLSQRYQFGRSLQDRHYDQAIVLPNSWKSALIPWVAKIPRRTGWRGELRYGLLNDIRLLDKKRYPLMVERFMALGIDRDGDISEPYPAPRFFVKKEWIEETISQFNLKLSEKPILAICPGAQFGPSKRWPTDYFAEIAKHYLNQHWQVVLLGSKEDKVAADDIQMKSENRCIHLAGMTNLQDAICLLSLAKIIVTNDSGLMHIAAALGKPLVAIYGSSSPHFTPPLSASAKILWLEIECSPCFKRECPLKHWRCMRELTPALVLSALKELELGH